MELSEWRNNVKFELQADDELLAQGVANRVRELSEAGFLDWHIDPIGFRALPHAGLSREDQIAFLYTAPIPDVISWVNIYNHDGKYVVSVKYRDNPRILDLKLGHSMYELGDSLYMVARKLHSESHKENADCRDCQKRFDEQAALGATSLVKRVSTRE